MAAVAAAAEGGEGEGEGVVVSAAGEVSKTSGTDGERTTDSKSKVDLAFVLDATGSMASYIASARQSINDIASKLKAEDLNVRFALVAYRDHPPQDSSFITQVTEFTPLPFLIKKKLDKLSASGGGDAPEAVAAGLFDTRYLKWRPDASKVIVLIADAPPHGLEPSGDGFPSEDPLTADRKKKLGGEGSTKEFHDILRIVRDIRDELEATIYTVACEPSVSTSYEYTRDFYQFVAECTDGKFLPLASANLLPQVIIGSVKQQIAMDALENRLDEEMDIIKEDFAKKEGREPTDEELDKLLTEKFEKAGVEVGDISVDSLYKTEPPRANIELLMNDQECPTLAEFKKKATKFPRLTRADMLFLGDSGASGTRVYAAPSGCPMPMSACPPPPGGVPMPPSRAMYHAPMGGPPMGGMPMPRMASTEDTCHFDAMFALEPVTDTCAEAPSFASSADGFACFTYAAPTPAMESAPPMPSRAMVQSACYSKSAVSSAHVSKVRKKAKRKKAYKASKPAPM